MQSHKTNQISRGASGCQGTGGNPSEISELKRGRSTQ